MFLYTMFKVETTKGRGFEKITLLNDRTGEYAIVIPDFGGNLQELKLQKDEEIFDVIVGNKTAKAMRENELARSAKLCPFPNRVNKGAYTWKDETHQLAINHPSDGHAIHGLVYDKQMNIKKMRGGRFGCQAILEYIHEGSEGYPWKFSLVVIYKLDKRGLQILTSIKNLDSQAIPLGDGWHPYFTLGCNADDIKLELPEVEKIVVDKNMIPTGKFSSYKSYSTPKKIGKTKFDTGFVVKQKSRYAETKLHGTDRTVVLWQNLPAYRYLQVYIPEKRDSVAVEPMSCMADAFNNKQGVFALQPKQSFRGRYGVRLE